MQMFQYIIENNEWYDIPARILSSIYHRLYTAFENKIIIKDLLNGKHFFVFPNHPLCNSFIYASTPEKNEIAILKSLIDENTVFLDIGANVGRYSVLLGDKVKKLFAFEAHPTTARFCRMNFLLNHMDDSQVFAIALGEDADPKYFTDLGQGSPYNERRALDHAQIKVPSTTLDNFIQHQHFDEDVNFIIKLDVNGYELEVMHGAVEFLSQYRVKGILLKTQVSAQSEMSVLLHNLGYQIQEVSNRHVLAVKL